MTAVQVGYEVQIGMSLPLKKGHRLIKNILDMSNGDDKKYVIVFRNGGEVTLQANKWTERGILTSNDGRLEADLICKF